MQACRKVSTPQKVKMEAKAVGGKNHVLTWIQMRSKFGTETGREFHASHTFNVKEFVCAWVFICF